MQRARHYDAPVNNQYMHSYGQISPVASSSSRPVTNWNHQQPTIHQQQSIALNHNGQVPLAPSAHSPSQQPQQTPYYSNILKNQHAVMHSSANHVSGLQDSQVLGSASHYQVAPQLNGQTPVVNQQVIELANERTQEIMRANLGPAFRGLWDSIHNTLASQYALELTRLRQELERARQETREANEKHQNSMRNCEVFLRAARKYKEEMDRAINKFNTLWKYHGALVNHALVLSRQLVEMKPGSKQDNGGDESDHVGSPSVDELEKRVLELEARLRKYEPVAEDISVASVTQEQPMINCETVADALNMTGISTTEILDVEKADRQRLQNGINIVAELVETGPISEAGVSSNATKKEQHSPLKTSYIDLTLSDEDVVQSSSEAAPLLSSRSQFELNSSGSSSTGTATANQISFIPGSLKRSVDDGTDQALAKRARTGSPPPVSVELAHDEVDEQHQTAVETSNNTFSSQRDKEVELADYEAESLKTSLEITSPAIDGSQPSGSSSIAGPYDDNHIQKQLPDLNDLHFEIMYHKSARSGEYICRLCSAELEGDLESSIFPADASATAKIEHGMLAHAELVEKLVVMEKDILLNVIQKLYDKPEED